MSSARLRIIAHTVSIDQTCQTFSQWKSPPIGKFKCRKTRLKASCVVGGHIYWRSCEFKWIEIYMSAPNDSTCQICWKWAEGFNGARKLLGKTPERFMMVAFLQTLHNLMMHWYWINIVLIVISVSLRSCSSTGPLWHFHAVILVETDRLKIKWIRNYNRRPV